MDTSASCRILVVSSDPSLSKSVVDQIIARSQSTSPNDQYSTFHDEDGSEALDEPDVGAGHLIHWTIDNKYYNAPVHFLVQPLSLPPAKPLWPPEDEDDKVPAILFTYVNGKPYKERFLSLKEAIQAHDAEVTLAVRVSNGSDVDNGDSEDLEVASDFFSDHGFELVEVELEHDEEEENTSSIPVIKEPQSVDPFDVHGIPRIINALSTIMWPSLTRKKRTSKPYLPTPGSLISQARLEAETDNDEDAAAGELFVSIPTTRDSSVFDIAGDPHSEDLNAIKSLFASLDGAIADRDLEKLEAWLDSDEYEPWKRSTSTPIPVVEGDQRSAQFDDDFTDFVSAPLTPAPLQTGSSGALPSSTEAIQDIGRTAAGEDDQSEEMPTEAEIRLTAQRLFGIQKPAKPLSDIETLDATAADDKPGQKSGSSDVEEPFNFDLAELLGALQTMKEEVGEIQDVQQRRKAAARVALAFASGLGLDEQDL